VEPQESRSVYVIGVVEFCFSIKKEHQLHCDIREGDNVFYFTTCGWMMWNWLVSVLASKASIVLFDGSPMYKKNDLLLKIAEKEKNYLIWY